MAGSVGSPDMALRLGGPPLQLDLMPAIDGVTYEAAASEATERPIASAPNLSGKVISLRHLRIYKAAICRPQGLLDLMKLPEA
jgi:hypothetical protein